MFHVKHHSWLEICMSDGTYRYVLLNSGNLESLYHSLHTLLDERPGLDGAIIISAFLANYGVTTPPYRKATDSRLILFSIRLQYENWNNDIGKNTHRRWWIWKPTTGGNYPDPTEDRISIISIRHVLADRHKQCSTPPVMSFPIDPVQVMQYHDFRHLNECGSNRRNIYSHRSASLLMFHVKHQPRRLIRTILDVSPHLTEM